MQLYMITFVGVHRKTEEMKSVGTMHMAKSADEALAHVLSRARQADWLIVTHSISDWSDEVRAYADCFPTEQQPASAPS